MGKPLQDQIYQHYHAKETEELLDIWQNGDEDEWDERVFKVIEDILVERLGALPAGPTRRQISALFDSIVDSLQKGDHARALSACERAIQLMPDSAIAYNYRGEIYDEMGRVDEAILNYQTAIQLDPNLKAAWENFQIAEEMIEEKFLESPSKRHLDQAFEFWDNDDLEKALEEIALAKTTIPNIASAHHYLGLILEEIDQIHSAIDAYLRAIQLNPRFYEARESLGRARKKLEGEQHHWENLGAETVEFDWAGEMDETQLSDYFESAEPLPYWYYLDEKAFVLTGWPGHRTRPGRSGYDLIEVEAEYGRMLGVILRELLHGRLRTRNPIYLLMMAAVGFLFCMPLLGAISQLNSAVMIFGVFMVVVMYGPYWLAGLALIANVVMSFLPGDNSESVENGYCFY